MDFQEKRIGSLWRKRSAKGEFFSGSIDKDKVAALGDENRLNIVIFENNHKREGKNDPDLIILFNDWKKPQQ
jgi:hypothetical protein